MPTNSRDIFTTLTTEGALLPPDILQRIADGDESLEGLSPQAYHQYGRLNEATNFVWNRLQGFWQAFQSARAKLPEGDAGTSLTRERWLLPLFDLLGYGRLDYISSIEHEGQRFSISHQWRRVPINLIGCNSKLDERSKQGSPHSQVQVLLNRDDSFLWGFLSNGLRLRILRDNISLTRQAYIEFDLESMMEGEVYSDFVLLYLLCHQSRVEAENPADYWLEQWRKTAEAQGKRALDELRDGVERAITHLGTGFLEHPQNIALRDALQTGALDKQDYYRQLLRLVYRLLFLFVAEDRNLLHLPSANDAQRKLYHFYSSQRLREIAANLRGTRHHDLYESLRLVMQLLGGTSIANLPSPLGRRDGDEGLASLLGLPVLGSFLFEDAAMPAIIAAKIANRDLLEAVRAISSIEDSSIHRLRRVDFKNLGSEELGSVYESLLELHPEIENRRFRLDSAGGNERKTTGSYYTPTSLINALLDSALDPVLEEAVKGSPQPKSFSQGAKDLLPSTLGRGAGGEGIELLRRGTKDAEIYGNIASKAMVSIGRDLRQRQTPTELTLWEALRDRRLNNLKFRRQHPIANTTYVVDFLCYEAKLIVEIDGGIHQQQKTEDAKRQAEIESLGYRFLRVTTEELQADLQWVLATIAHTAANQSSPTSTSLPSTLGRGAGGEGKEGAAERILALKICDPACGSGHFLIAAAHRIAKRLAQVQTGEDEPTPAAVNAAKREVIAHCIYGVDINPMAVELCKVNLWLESIDPGKPLSFLDHRIQVGNSLLGTTPALMAKGIPDEAFSPIEGDDKAFVSTMKKLNKKEREQRKGQFGNRQLGLFDDAPSTDYRALSRAMHELDAIPDSTLEGIRRKAAYYAALANDPDYNKARLLADAWCAAFVWEKTPSSKSPMRSGGGVLSLRAADGDLEGDAVLPLTDLLYRRMERDPLAANLAPTRATIIELAQQYQFFHWHIAFPDVFTVDTTAENEQTGWNGGFDVLLGNPPWERIKIQEKEWFAQRAPEIANAANAAARRKAIVELEQNNPELLADFAQDKRKAEGESHFVRVSARYPLTGVGDVNTYAIFTELARTVLSSTGYSGLIIPTGIATDNTYQHFFADVVANNQLVNLFDFENRGHLFSALHTKTKFSIFSLTNQYSKVASFCFLATQVSDLQDKDKVFELSAEDFELINPNTRTCPLFRSRYDAEITKSIYRNIPILIDYRNPKNLWMLSFFRMFDMTNDSNLFQNEIANNRLRLYEAKMIWHFDHRWATYTDDEQTVLLTSNERVNPHNLAKPRYWVDSFEVQSRLSGKWQKDWFIGFRGITDSRNERTMIMAVTSPIATGNSMPLAVSEIDEVNLYTGFLSNMNSYVLDYVVRQKIAGTNLNFFIVEQLPVLPPHSYTQALLDFIVPRVLELTYTAWDLQPFAQDLGYQGAPFVWDEDRRFLLRCELDALYFHLYQISRDDVDYIMETFPIVKRKDSAAYGSYRTKDTILAMFDEMAQLPSMSIPAPKGEGDYRVPDVSQWNAATTPPPADASVAHPEK